MRYEFDFDLNIHKCREVAPALEYSAPSSSLQNSIPHIGILTARGCFSDQKVGPSIGLRHFTRLNGLSDT
jgi:hypothetical protein